jgi:hypothetical protein
MENHTTMRTFVLYAAFLSSLAMAQGPGPSFNNQQRTTGFAGIAPGQTARLIVLYPTAPAPIFQISCSATLSIFDNQGNVLKSTSVNQLTGGKSVSIDVNADTDLAGAQRTEVYGLSISPGCNFVTTLEVIDNATQKTSLAVGSQVTYPVATATTTPATAAAVAAR